MKKEIKTLEAIPFVFAGKQLRIRTVYFLERAVLAHKHLRIPISI